MVKFYIVFCLCARKAVSNIYNLLRTGGETVLIFLAKCPLFEVYSVQCRKPEWQLYMEVRSHSNFLHFILFLWLTFTDTST